MIECNKAGKVLIDGQEYRTDVIVYPERVDNNWRMKERHNLKLGDLQGVLDYKPEVLVIGKGKIDLVNVSAAVQLALEEQGIEVFTSSTDKAIKKYNEVSKQKKAVAVLHLSC